MTATIKVDTIKEVNSTVDNIVLDSSGNVTIGNNLTVTGATTQTGSTTFTAQTLFADGSVSAPAISNTGDTNCGIYFPAADTLGFVTSGTEGGRFDSVGNLLLNSATLSPTQTAAGSIAMTGTLAMGSSFKRNRLINGSLEVWQRGTSFSPAGTVIYGVDRFWIYSTYAVYTRQSYGTTDFNYCTRVQRPASNTSTGGSYFQQIIESVNCQGLAGGNATFSFYARRGADYSPTSNLLTTSIFFGSGTDQGVAVLTGAGWTNQTNPTSTVTLTTSWQRFSVTVAVPANTNEISVGFLYVPVGTALTNDYFEVAGLQFEPGSVATPYERQIYSEQLAQCQRYLPAFPVGNLGRLPFVGNASAGNTIWGTIIFPVTTRIPPTGATVSSAAHFGAGVDGLVASAAFSAFSFSSIASQFSARLTATTSTSPFSTNQVVAIDGNNASANIYFTGCEL